MNQTVPTCPTCGSDGADSMAAVVCKDSFHTEHAAEAAEERARVEALAAGKSMAEAAAAGVRARREFEDERDPTDADDVRAQIAEVAFLLEPATEDEEQVVDDVTTGLSRDRLELLETMICRRLDISFEAGKRERSEAAERINQVIEDYELTIIAAMDRRQVLGVLNRLIEKLQLVLNACNNRFAELDAEGERS